MNNELKQAKQNVKSIEQFCKSRPTPTPEKLSEFMEKKGISSEYNNFAENFLKSVLASEFIFYKKKINKSR